MIFPPSWRRAPAQAQPQAQSFPGQTPGYGAPMIMQPNPGLPGAGRASALAPLISPAMYGAMGSAMNPDALRQQLIARYAAPAPSTMSSYLGDLNQGLSQFALLSRNFAPARGGRS